jgi:hypothetical protein
VVNGQVSDAAVLQPIAGASPPWDKVPVAVSAPVVQQLADVGTNPETRDLDGLGPTGWCPGLVG